MGEHVYVLVSNSRSFSRSVTSIHGAFETEALAENRQAELENGMFDLKFHFFKKYGEGKIGKYDILRSELHKLDEEDMEKISENTDHGILDRYSDDMEYAVHGVWFTREG